MAYLSELDFEELGGDTDAVTAFSLYEAKACALIDRLTHGRIKHEKPVRTCVKHAVYELVMAMHAAEQHGGREVTAINNDGVSVNYAATGSAAASGFNLQYLRIVREWLDGEVTGDGVPLLYAGVEV